MCACLSIYKGIGSSKVGSEGTLDRCKFYDISKDDLFNITPLLSGPSTVGENRDLCKSFASEGHTLSLFILSHSEKYLHLPLGAMVSMHQAAEPSGDQVRVLVTTHSQTMIAGLARSPTQTSEP